MTRAPGDAHAGAGDGSAAPDRLPDEAWVTLLGSDPRPWLLASDEPAAVWAILSGLLDVPEDAAEAAAARSAVLADPGTRMLVEALPPWDSPEGFPGHDSPRFAPNALHLLYDMGVRPGDDPRVDRLLDAMLAHQDPDGRFASFGRMRSLPEPMWGALLCDTHAICEVLVRYGKGDDPRVQLALECMSGDLAETAQGMGWPCRAEPRTGFRGPGRKADVCPQVTLEALRVLSLRPARVQPEAVLDVARTILGAWRERGTRQPYMFGHGMRFKSVKWPHYWYDVLSVVDTLGRYPGLWCGSGALEEDRSSLAELAACLVAYNFGPDGRVTPRRTYRGFEVFSFGQKKRPSAFATAQAAIGLRRFEALSEVIRAVDVTRLGSSKGGSGTAVAPRI